MIGDPIRAFLDVESERNRILDEMFHSLPNIIRALRGTKTQQMFAEELGINRVALNRLERNPAPGIIGKPVLRRLLEMADRHQANGRAHNG